MKGYPKNGHNLSFLGVVKVGMPPVLVLIKTQLQE